MFRFHCPCCTSHRVAVYYPRPANNWTDTTVEIFAETAQAIEVNNVDMNNRSRVFGTKGTKLPFLCIDCGHLTTEPLQPLENADDVNKLGMLNPTLVMVN